MKPNNYLLSFLFLFFYASTLANQGTDTVWVDATKINTKFLKEGNNRYLVYFKLSKEGARARPQFWTRNVSFENYNGKEAIVVKQEWEDRDSVVHTVKSVCDKKTFAPLYHQSWWKQRGTGEYDFINKTAKINDLPLTDADTAKNRKGPWQAFQQAVTQYTLNWHLDLEVFPLLPYKINTTFMIPFYDPGYIAPKFEAYTVTGSGQLEGYDNQKVDCWLLTHESRGLKEVFWISKKTQEVLKLENEIGKDRWRYKVKLGFSV
ncbi:DUF3108 domain-containing protein [Emticicia agri]|uniref:DUF3108 domain-containing protein n=1 Tax=Emticicia agri TaxID=2492393 RepID=A0A4Q5LW09_9BACT|nr:hypothetical protein [Emticicia agri]RYU93898.1 hypothetical protein EWM59_19860 [Emticicia agri]